MQTPPAGCGANDRDEGTLLLSRAQELIHAEYSYCNEKMGELQQRKIEMYETLLTTFTFPVDYDEIIKQEINPLHSDLLQASVLDFIFSRHGAELDYGLLKERFLASIQHLAAHERQESIKHYENLIKLMRISRELVDKFRSSQNADDKITSASRLLQLLEFVSQTTSQHITAYPAFLDVFDKTCLQRLHFGVDARMQILRRYECVRRENLRLRRQIEQDGILERIAHNQNREYIQEFQQHIRSIQQADAEVNGRIQVFRVEITRCLDRLEEMRKNWGDFNQTLQQLSSDARNELKDAILGDQSGCITSEHLATYVNNLRAQRSQLQDTIQKAKARNNALETEIQQLQGSLQKSALAVQEQELKNSQCESSLLESHAEITTLKQQIVEQQHNHQQQLLKSASMVSQKDAEALQLREQLQTMQQMLQHMQQSQERQYLEFQDQYKKQQEQIVEQTKINSRLEMEHQQYVNESNMQMQQQQLTNQSSQQQLQNEITGLANQVAQLNVRNDLLSKQLGEQQSLLQQERASSEEQKLQLNSIIQEQQKMHAEDAMKIQEEIHNYKEQISMQEAKHQELVRGLTATIEQHRRDEERRGVLAGKTAQQIMDYGKQLCKIRDDLRSCRNEILESKFQVPVEISQAFNKVKAMHDNVLSAVQQQSQAYLQRVQELERQQKIDATNNQNQVSALNREIELLQGKYQQLEQEKTRLMDQTWQQRATIQELQSAKDSMGNQAAKLERDLKAAVQDKEILTQQHRDQILDLNRQVDRQQQQYAMQVKDAETQLQECLSQLNKQRDERIALDGALQDTVIQLEGSRNMISQCQATHRGQLQQVAKLLAAVKTTVQQLKSDALMGKLGYLDYVGQSFEGLRALCAHVLSTHQGERERLADRVRELGHEAQLRESGLAGQISGLQQQILQLQGAKGDAQEALRKTEEEAARRGQRIEQLCVENTVLKKQAEQQTSTINTMQQGMEKSEEQMNALRNELTRQQREYAELSGQHSALVQKQQNCDQELAAMRQTQQSREAEMAELQSQKNSAIAAEQELKHNLATVQMLYDACQREKEEKQKQLDKMSIDARNQSNRMTAQINDLKAVLAREQEKYAALRRQADEKDIRIRELNSQLARKFDTEKEIVKRQKQIEQLTQQITELMQKIQSKDHQIGALSRKIDDLEIQNHKQQEFIDNMKIPSETVSPDSQESAKLATMLQRKDAEVRTCNTQIAHLNQRVKELQQQIAEMQNELHTLSANESTMASQLRVKDQELEVKAGQISRLQDELQRSQTQQVELQTRSQLLEKELAVSQSNLQQTSELYKSAMSNVKPGAAVLESKATGNVLSISQIMVNPVGSENIDVTGDECM